MKVEEVTGENGGLEACVCVCVCVRAHKPFRRQLINQPINQSINHLSVQ